MLSGLHAFRPLSDEDVHGETDQLGSERGEALESPLGKAGLDGEVVPLHPATLAQRMAEGLQPPRQLGGESRPAEKADPGEGPRRLGRGGARRDAETEGEDHEKSHGAAP